MSKKPKIDKRLDKLFKGLAPEESAVKPKSTQKDGEVLPPSPVESSSAPTQHPTFAPVKPEAASRPSPTRRDIGTLILPDPATVRESDNITSTYSVNIQTGYQDWAALRILHETNHRQWPPAEEVLLKQVSENGGAHV